MAGYPDHVWATIKQLRFSGRFRSWKQVQAEARKLLRGYKIPSIEAMKKKSQKEKWDSSEEKDKVQKEVEEKLFERMERRFEKQGFESKEAIDELILMIRIGTSREKQFALDRYFKLTGLDKHEDKITATKQDDASNEAYKKRMEEIRISKEPKPDNVVDITTANVSNSI